MSAAYCIDCFENASGCECGNPSGVQVFGERRIADLADRGLRPIEKEQYKEGNKENNSDSEES